MILDEAHSIKNINSIRWNTLLEFSCRNRLLLTGTPIQNSMSELWALLHFIMPNLFDSHEHFQEWFSKDIEAHSQAKGELNEEQLKRLHTILKPFMLRRVKKDVENEIGQKTEFEIFCDMTNRQTVLYNTIKSKLNTISDLFTSTESRIKVDNLMNLVMQFRKVCNHPELFERHMGKIPLYFRNLFLSSSFNKPITLSAAPLGGNSNDEIYGIFPDNGNIIKYYLPKLIYDEILQDNISNNFKNNKVFNLKNDKNLKITSFSAFSAFDQIFDLLPFSNSDLLSLICSNQIISLISLIHYFGKFLIKQKYIEDYKKSDDEDNKVSLFNSKYSRISLLITRELFNHDCRITAFIKAKKQLNIDSSMFCNEKNDMLHYITPLSTVKVSLKFKIF